MSSKTEFKFLDKQTIHIISEIVVIAGISFYFSSKNKQLLNHIEELAQKLEQQEDHIQKLELAIQQTNAKCDAIIQQMNSTFMQMGQNLNQTNANLNAVVEDKKQKNKVKYTDPPRAKPTVEISEESEDEEEIDKAIKAELEDLEE
jgi:nitrogen fixation/metabolism regulation signal transduction histidine kinase